MTDLSRFDLSGLEPSDLSELEPYLKPGLGLVTDGLPGKVTLFRAFDPGLLEEKLFTSGGLCVEFPAGSASDVIETLRNPENSADCLLSLTTATASRGSPGLVFVRWLCKKLQISDPVGSISGSVHEAVTNAVIHGNLGIGTLASYESADSFAFFDKMEEQLCDPLLANKRVNILARWSDHELEISVTDQGSGVPGLTPDVHEGEMARGLTIIQKLARRVELDLEGRRITMVFDR